MSENPSVVFIQEISISTALTVFAPLFKVFINICLANDGIGIVTLVSNDINVIDFKVGDDGRTIGIKTRETQFWHVYPKSGSQAKPEREKFFREILPNHMAVWKDHTTNIIQGGDHNATIRKIDSQNNQEQLSNMGIEFMP